jgi:hypothetical protein
MSYVGLGRMMEGLGRYFKVVILDVTYFEKDNAIKAYDICKFA